MWFDVVIKCEFEFFIIWLCIVLLDYLVIVVNVNVFWKFLLVGLFVSIKFDVYFKEMVNDFCECVKFEIVIVNVIFVNKVID